MEPLAHAHCDLFRDLLAHGERRRPDAAPAGRCAACAGARGARLLPTLRVAAGRGRAPRGASLTGPPVLPCARCAVGLPESGRSCCGHASVRAPGGPPGHRVCDGVPGTPRVEGSGSSDHRELAYGLRGLRPPVWQVARHRCSPWLGLYALVLPPRPQGPLSHPGARGASSRSWCAPHRYLDARRQLGGVQPEIPLRCMARAFRHRPVRFTGDIRGPHRTGEESRDPA